MQLHVLKNKPDTSIITEDMINAYLKKDRDVLVAGDLKEIKRILPTYIEKIIVYKDRIEAHFRLSVDERVCAWMVAVSGFEPLTLRV
ncbi:MAG: hypothetical protein PWQ93_1695 [Clostridiales bacterium]|nr:hypothetical protein [Clostridiales bacterium]